MKYTANITQKQYIKVGHNKNVIIFPGDGELSNKDIEQVKSSPYGKKLIASGVLKIEETKRSSDSNDCEGKDKSK